MVHSPCRDAHLQFTAQIEHSEAFARQAPAEYRRRVVLLTLLGYAYPLLVLGGLFALTAALFGLLALFNEASFLASLFSKLIVAPLVLSVVVARAMWIKFEAPAGLRLKRREAVEFFAFVDEVRKRCGNPRIHRIYVTPDLNAAVLQSPRLGLLGWYRNDLILGLPLLQALSRNEVAAVIAHELGHLTGAHGKTGAWIYRTRQLMANIQQATGRSKSLGSWFLRRFYNWYGDFFTAFSFPLARDHEYEADCFATHVTSPAHTVQALARSRIAAEFLDEVFWPEVEKTVGTRKYPTEQLYEWMGEHLTGVEDWPGAAKSLRRALTQPTDYTDTHPSLSDRAAAIGMTVDLPEKPSERAVAVLPCGGAQIAAAFSREWYLAHGPQWEESHSELVEQRQKLDELDEAATQGRLSEEAAYRRATLADLLLDPSEALTRTCQALQWHDTSAELLLLEGKLLLSLRQASGLKSLDRAMALDPDATMVACQLAIHHLYGEGDGKGAEKYLRLRRDQELLLAEDYDDRTWIFPNDQLSAPSYDPLGIDDLVSVLSKYRKKGLRYAWLVRKTTRHRAWDPAHFLICDIGPGSRLLRDIDDLQEEINADLFAHPGVVAMVCDFHHDWLSDMARRVSSAQVYPQASADDEISIQQTRAT